MHYPAGESYLSVSRKQHHGEYSHNGGTGYSPKVFVGCGVAVATSIEVTAGSLYGLAIVGGGLGICGQGICGQPDGTVTLPKNGKPDIIIQELYRSEAPAKRPSQISPERAGSRSGSDLQRKRRTGQGAEDEAVPVMVTKEFVLASWPPSMK
jgi:hypothetical protein